MGIKDAILECTEGLRGLLKSRKGWVFMFCFLATFILGLNGKIDSTGLVIVLPALAAPFFAANAIEGIAAAKLKASEGNSSPLNAIQNAVVINSDHKIDNNET